MNRTLNRYVSDEDKSLGMSPGAKLVLGTTINGKTVRAKTAVNSSNYVIEFEDGGELPLELQGEFTSISTAQTVVNTFLVKKELQAAPKTILKAAPKETKTS